jgi:hypothetical protein
MHDMSPVRCLGKHKIAQPIQSLRNSDTLRFATYLIVISMADFMTNDGAYRSKINWHVSKRLIFCGGAKKRLLENGRRENNLIPSWVEVSVDDKRRHLPTFLINWLVNALQHAKGLHRVQYSDILRIRFAPREALCDLRYVIKVPRSVIAQNKEDIALRKPKNMLVNETRFIWRTRRIGGQFNGHRSAKVFNKSQHRSPVEYK